MESRISCWALLVCAGFFLRAGASEAAPSLSASEAERLLVRLLSSEDSTRGTVRIGILRSGDRSLLPALVDSLFFASPAARSDVVACLKGLSGEHLGNNYRYWIEYLGGHEDSHPHAGYREWKAALFARIDPAFGLLLDPSAPPARASLALLYANEGRQDEARQALEKLARLRTPSALFAAARTYEILGDRENAIRLRQEIRKLFPYARERQNAFG